ncbi:MAG TPA: hypothetical protein VFY95_10390 [Sphingomicrobium sp.]
MDFGELIPIAGIFGGVAFAWIGFKYRQLTLTHRQSEHQAALDAAEKKRLEQRLAILERIVTDKGLHTADQIEALRDRETQELR